MKCPFVLWALFLLVASFSPCPLLSADEQQEVEESFKRFNQQWMEFLYAQEKKGRENIVCTKVDDFFVAEYTAYSRTYSSTTKKTSSPETPYIGILKYQEQKYECRGKTFEAAISGPFVLKSEYPVTEIFSFSRGKWQY